MKRVKRTEDTAIILNYEKMKAEKRSFPYFIEGTLIACLSIETSKGAFDFGRYKTVVDGVIDDFLNLDPINSLAENCPVMKQLLDDCLRYKASVINVNEYLFITCPKALKVDNFKKILEESLGVSVTIEK